MARRNGTPAKQSSQGASWAFITLVCVLIVGGAAVYIATAPSGTTNPSSAVSSSSRNSSGPTTSSTGIGVNGSGSGSTTGSNTNSGSSPTTTLASTSFSGGPCSTSSTGQFAVIQTTQGTFEVQLFPNAAPKTVANFASLAQSGFYNHLVWHRIVAGFAIQTGDPTTRNGGGNQSTWGQTGSNQTVPLETSQTLVNEGCVNGAGFLGMARTSDPNSGSSQFFVNLVNNTSLNGQYTVFGKVISGMSVVDAIGSLQVNPQCSSSGGLDCQPLDSTNAEVLSITIQNAP